MSTTGRIDNQSPSVRTTDGAGESRGEDEVPGAVEADVSESGEATADVATGPAGSAVDLADGPETAVTDGGAEHVATGASDGRCADWLDRLSNGLAYFSNLLFYYSDDLLAKTLSALVSLLACWVVLMLPVILLANDETLPFGLLDLLAASENSLESVPLALVYAIVVQVLATGLALEELLRPRDIISFSRYAVISHSRFPESNGSRAELRGEPLLRIRYFVKLRPGEQLYSARVDIMAQTEDQKRGEDPERDSQWRKSLPPDDQTHHGEYFGIRGVRYVDVSLQDSVLKKTLRNNSEFRDVTVRITGQTRFGQNVTAEMSYPRERILEGYNFKSVNGRDVTADNRPSFQWDRHSYLDLVFDEREAGGTVNEPIEGLGEPKKHHKVSRESKPSLGQSVRGAWSSGHSVWAICMRVILLLVELLALLPTSIRSFLAELSSLAFQSLLVFARHLLVEWPLLAFRSLVKLVKWSLVKLVKWSLVKLVKWIACITALASMFVHILGGIPGLILSLVLLSVTAYVFRLGLLALSELITSRRAESTRRNDAEGTDLNHP